MHYLKILRQGLIAKKVLEISICATEFLLRIAMHIIVPQQFFHASCKQNITVTLDYQKETFCLFLMSSKLP